jgi:hypothetical protein
VLLKVYRFGPHDKPANIKMPKMNQQTLAEIVAAPRSRISVFTNKFRKLGRVLWLLSVLTVQFLRGSAVRSE